MMAWKYTLPAFLVPLAFVLEPAGLGLLGRGPWATTLWTTATAMLGLVPLAAALCGWLRRETSPLERALLAGSGLLLVYPGWTADLLGLGGGLAALAWHGRRRGTPRAVAGVETPREGAPALATRKDDRA